MCSDEHVFVCHRCILHLQMFHVLRALGFIIYKCDNVLMLIQITLLTHFETVNDSVCIECILSAVKHVILLLFSDLPLVHLRLY